MSRLDYAPKLKEIEITDITAGRGAFTPKPDKPVSFAAMKLALKRAGYKLASSTITVKGTLARDADSAGWRLLIDSSGQSFIVEGKDAKAQLKTLQAGERVELSGDWQTIGEEKSAREIIYVGGGKKLSVTTPARTESASWKGALFENQTLEVELLAGARASERAAPRAVPLGLAPIRTTSPGLTVYKGGAISPRLFLTRQHLGNLTVSRQSLLLSASYTPTPTLQLETEIPFTHTSFDDGTHSGAGAGFGNATVWAKYRFYRVVEEWGDRQAALRFGAELPTGKKNAPDETELNAPAFVRQHLSPINGGLAGMLDAAYSQARGRLVFGGNVEAILRTERAGYRTGHELRANTDLEYVVFPLKYRRPTGEIIANLETNFIRRWERRVGGQEVAASRATEFYVAPALQYAASPRIVVEASFQLPLVRQTGAQVLRTSSNILMGVRYLF